MEPIKKVWQTLIFRCSASAGTGRRVCSALLLGFSVVVCGVALAQEDENTLYDVYRISSEASADVDNDLMLAILVVQEEDKDAAMLADRINASMGWAINVMRPFHDIKVKTRDYQTYPRYDNSSARRLIGWRASQSIELETDDFSAAGKAIQRLQERLKVQSINLSVKPETRDKASDQLIENALDAFKERARLVQRNMGRGSFRVLEVDVRTEQSAMPYGDMPMASEARSFNSTQEVSAPAIAGGSTTVVVRINGRIQLD